MNILVCGSREWSNKEVIRRILSEYDPTQTKIIHGDCRGADKLAGEIAEELGMELDVYPADWDNLGKKAGMIRNHKMLKHGKPDYVIAFAENIEATKGTKMMVRMAVAARIHGRIVRR